MSSSQVTKIKLDPEKLKNMGPKGNVLIVIQSALVLAASNDFKGTKIKGFKKPKAFIDSKAWKGLKNGDGGAYWQLKEQEKPFLKLHKLAKAAIDSINELEYDKSVKNLINAFYAIPAIKGRKKKTLDKNSLNGLTL